MSSNNYLANKLKSIDYLIVLFLFLSVFSFLYFSGTLNSGYHFTDDHEILTLNSELKNSSIFDTLRNHLRADFEIRFRPMYYFHRILEIKIFETNFFLLSLYTGLLASLTFSFFFLGARKLGYSVFESLLFVFIALLGTQSLIWWQLGPAETIGMFFLSLSMFFLARCRGKRRYLLNSILFNIFLISSSLCKESFAILIPAFVLFKIWSERTVFNVSLAKSIRNNYLSALSMATMVIEIWFIAFAVGIQTLKYAGPTSGFTELINGIRNILVREDMLLEWLKLIVIILVIYSAYVAFMKFKKNDMVRKYVQDIYPSFFAFALIILPNILLYAKSGMVRHYLVPATFGIAFFVINIIINMHNNIFRRIALFACIIFVYSSFNMANQTAAAFTSEGLTTNELLSTITNHVNSNVKLLLAADPIYRYESSYSLKTYLKYKNFDNLYAYPMIRDYNSDYERGLKTVWDKWFENKKIQDMKGEPDIVVFIYDKIQAEQFFNQSNISQSDYRNILGTNNPHGVFVRNNSL